jgi:hypothetical protein
MSTTALPAVRACNARRWFTGNWDRQNRRHGALQPRPLHNGEDIDAAIEAVAEIAEIRKK